MKILIFTSFLILLATASGAQQRAVTETGDQVILYNDGRWIYADKDSVKTDDIPVNNKSFGKSKTASFLVKSKRINIGCWIDPKVWKFRSAETPSAAEFEFDHVNGSLYGLIISENLDIPTESLANLAVNNAREAAPDIKVTAKEYRIVNGTKVLMLRMAGTIEDIRFSYYGYYYAADGGAMQFLVYTSDTFMDENIDTVEQLLNGFVLFEK